MAARSRGRLRQLSDRLFVERQIYERRPDGPSYRTITRGRRIALLCLQIFLLLLSAVAGAAGSWLLLGGERPLVRLGLVPAVVAPVERRAESTPPAMAGPVATPTPVAPAAPATNALAIGPAELAALRARLEGAERKVQEQAEQLAALRQETATQRADRTAAAQQGGRDIQALNERIAAITADNGVLQEKLQAAEARSSALEAELRGTDAATAGASDEPLPEGEEDLRLEVTLLRHERDAARQQIDALMQLGTRLKEDLELARNKAPDARPAPQLADLQARLATTEQRLATAEGEATLAEATLGKVRGDLEAKLAEAERRLAEAESGRAAGDEAGRSLQSDNAELAQRLAAAEAGTRSAEEELARARDAAAATEERARELDQRLERESAAGDAQARAMALLQDEAERLRGRLQAMESDAATRAEAARLLESTVAALEAQQKGLGADLDRVKAERDTLAASVAARQGDSDHAAAAAGAQIADLRAGSDRLAQDVARLQGDLARTGAENEQLRSRLAEIGDRAAGDAASLATVTAERDEARRQLAELPAVTGIDAAASIAGASAGVSVGSGSDPALKEELDAALARLRDLGLALDQSEGRNRQLEQFLTRYAPGPPARAPR